MGLGVSILKCIREASTNIYKYVHIPAHLSINLPKDSFHLCVSLLLMNLYKIKHIHIQDSLPDSTLPTHFTYPTNAKGRAIALPVFSYRQAKQKLCIDFKDQSAVQPTVTAARRCSYMILNVFSEVKVRSSQNVNRTCTC